MGSNGLRLSVVLTTYNGARYLPAQLQSLLDQTRLPDELVACDDGSKDETVEILNEFAAKAPFQVRVHRQPANLGVNQNFSSALQMASGDVLLCCDQDDVWLPSRLARLGALFESDQEVGLVMNDANLVDAELNPLNRTLWQQCGFRLKDQDRFENGEAFNLLTRGLAVFGATTAIRADRRAYFLPIPPGLPFDTWFGRMLAASGACRLIREPLQNYRQHASQMFGARQDTRLVRILRMLKANTAQSVSSELPMLIQAAQKIAALPESVYRRAAEKSLNTRLRLTRNREIARRSIIRRVPFIVANLLSGRYRRGAQGIRSAALDLIAKPEQVF